ncbi:MAG TPA: BrxA/BrxB family bacilliredoxin [Gemmatimonadales bacterium]|nr:BrxA/BrxB family bacilliredoxin [Gemmatimonadales bacterium]
MLKDMPYNPELVAPMRAEVTRLGAKELTTAGEVDTALGDQKGTMLVFVNSVCGCAAGNARPALALALKHAVRPQELVTVFAGQDLDAAARARQYFGEYQPSSPSMALLRDGEVVHFVHRHQIEGRSPQAIASELTAAFDRYCGAPV